MWTIEKELIYLAGGSSIETSMVNLGLIGSLSEAFFIDSANSSWCKLGSETWSYRFKILLEEHSIDLIVKCCAPSFAPIPVSEICDKWFLRRRCLCDSGVTAPCVLVRKGATWIEEYVPFSLEEALRENEYDDVIESLAYTLSILYTSGYQPISLHDIRSTGHNAVLIDFGWDLGEKTLIAV